MRKRKKSDFLSDMPELEQVRRELKREQYKIRYRAILWNTIHTLILVAAVAVFAANVWIPVFRIRGNSMAPTLNEQEIVVAVKKSSFAQGDLVAFYIGNKLLIKRNIAGPGQVVDIDQDGMVYVDGERLEEDYITEPAFGDCNIEFPYQVPENRYFMMGDHRKTSVDSRNTAVGCVSEEQIVGKILYRIWPFQKMGFLE